VTSRIYELKMLLSSFYNELATGLNVRGSNPRVGEIFRTRPDRPWSTPSLLYNGYRVFTLVKRPGRGVDHPTPTSIQIKETVELYLLPLWGFVVCSRVNCSFTFTFYTELSLPKRNVHYVHIT
jgi:hypothetical protein